MPALAPTRYHHTSFANATEMCFQSQTTAPTVPCEPLMRTRKCQRCIYNVRPVYVLPQATSMTSCPFEGVHVPGHSLPSLFQDPLIHPYAFS